MTQPEFIYIDSTLLAQCIATLSKSDAKADQHLAQYLSTYKLATRHDSTAEVIGTILREANATGLRSYTTDSAIERAGPRPKSTVRLAIIWGDQFLRSILDELRKLICGKGKNPTKLSDQSQAAIAALAVYIARQFHITNVTANGLVVFFLLKLGQATKNAFCKMTNAQVIAALNGAE
jgi:hypothetical protein